MKATAASPYPKTFEEFLEWFSSEEDCANYLEWIRWPDGFVCPECEETKAWRTDRGLWHCQGRGRQSSVTAGTIFEDSRKPLRLWFHVMWLMMAQKTGLSAKNLCDTYGFGSYQTAWGWLSNRAQRSLPMACLSTTNSKPKDSIIARTSSPRAAMRLARSLTMSIW